MKSEEEKKTRRVPTRMTQAQYEIIRQKALDRNNRNMSVSAFVVEAAVHDDKRITPLQIMHHVKSITGMGFRLVCEQRDNWNTI